MTDVNNISDVPFVAAEAHDVGGVCNTYQNYWLESEKPSKNLNLNLISWESGATSMYKTSEQEHKLCHHIISS